jgi:RNase adaptor protein for sRNA GlmZ degradation
MDSAPKLLTVHVYSFGFKFSGPPPDGAGHGGGFVFDCRALPNPFWDPAVRAYAGTEPAVAAWLEREPDVRDFAAHAAALVLQSARIYRSLGRERLQVAFGCTGGRHRSPYLAERLRRDLEAAGFRAELTHLDLDEEADRFAGERAQDGK